MLGEFFNHPAAEPSGHLGFFAFDGIRMKEVVALWTAITSAGLSMFSTGGAFDWFQTSPPTGKFNGIDTHKDSSFHEVFYKGFPLGVFLLIEASLMTGRLSPENNPCRISSSELWLIAPV